MGRQSGGPSRGGHGPAATGLRSGSKNLPKFGAGAEFARVSGAAGFPLPACWPAVMRVTSNFAGAVDSIEVHQRFRVRRGAVREWCRRDAFLRKSWHPSIALPVGAAPLWTPKQAGLQWDRVGWAVVR